MSDMQTINTQSELWAEIVPELRVDESGEGYASIRAAATLFGITHTTLNNHFKGGSQKPSQLSQLLMDNGFDRGNQQSFSRTGIPSEAMHLICCYYAMLAPQQNIKQEAIFLNLKMGGKTWRMAIQELTGYQPPQPEPTPAPLPTAETPQPESTKDDMIDALRECVIDLVAEVKHLKQKQRELSADQIDLQNYQSYQAHQHRLEVDAFTDMIKKIRIQIADNAEGELPPTPDLVRAEIKAMVNYSAWENGRDHRQEWTRLYQEFGRQYRITVEPEEGESRIDAFARLGYLNALHRVARLLFGYRAS